MCGVDGLWTSEPDRKDWPWQETAVSIWRGLYPPTNLSADSLGARHGITTLSPVSQEESKQSLLDNRETNPVATEATGERCVHIYVGRDLFVTQENSSSTDCLCLTQASLIP